MDNFKKITALTIICTMLAGMSFTSAYATGNLSENTASITIPSDAEYVEGEAIVCIENRAAGSLSADSSSISSLASDIPGFECEELMTLDGDVAADAERQSSLSASINSSDNKTIMLVKSSTMDTESLIETLEENTLVEFAEPNYIYTVDSVASNEPYYSEQWYLNNSENAGSDLNVTPIYDNVTTGSSDVVVALIDTGVDYTHEDLSGNMWNEGLNYPKLTALGGGKYGYCSVDSDYWGDEYDSTDPYDDYGHGTHCAGIIGAEWNNTGIAGVNGNVRIMSVKAGDSEGSLYTSSIIKAFNYVDAALECGVNVKAINNSYGGSYMGSAVLYAVNQCGSKGALSFFAAGNSSLNKDISDTDHLNSPYIVSVAAVNAEGKLAGFSDYGEQTVDIASPGAFILSTVPEQFGTYIPDLMSDEYTYAINNFDDKTSAKIVGSFDSSIDISTSEHGYTGKGLALDFNCSFDGYSAINIKFDNVPSGSKTSYFSTKIYGVQSECYAYLEYYDSKYKEWTYADLTYVSEGSWGLISFEIPGSANISKYGVNLEFYSVSEDVTECSYIIDDIALGSDTIPYAYYDGTSMATPAAVGVAALLASMGIDDVFELKARIIGGVNRTDELSEYTVSQGILDAEKAYYNPEAVVNSIEYGNDEIIVNGYFFGDDKGSVTMSGTELKVKQWSENSIVCEIPDNKSSGNYEFRVTASDGRTGREFFKYDGKDSDWKSLSAENITKCDEYYENYGVEFCEADGDLYALMQFLYDEEYVVYELYKYSIGGDSWEKLLTLDSDIYSVYALCGIGSNVYLVCGVENAEDFATQLLCYDTKNQKLNVVNDDIPLYGMQCGTDYNGKILMVDGYIYDDDYYYDDDFYFDFDLDFDYDYDYDIYAYEIDPKDGSVEISDIEIPDEFWYSKIKSSGDKLLYYNTAYDNLDGQYDGAYYYNGTSWINLPDISNLSDIMYESFDFSFTQGGIVMSGHILDSESGNYVDVLEYDFSEKCWVENNNIYSTNDVMFLGGTTLTGRYYVFSKLIDESGSYEFKSLYMSTNITGDVNCDGVLNIDDATYLQKYIAGFSGVIIDESNIKEFMIADFNGDSVINIDDVTDIQKYIAGIYG